MVTLLVVEDHALVREGLLHTLRQLDEGVSVFGAADCADATALLKQGQVFDLMVLDLALPGIDGLSYLRTLRRRYPAMPVVILSAYDDVHTVKKAMKSGAAGFVSKSYSSDRLLTVLREVLGGVALAADLLPATSVAKAPRAPIGKHAEPSDFGLTERQTEVLGLMARGKTNREIAGLLGLSEGTVKVHLTATFKALGVSSRTQAIVVIARRGIRL
jgi:DNA-binding NarL/FixJ family response regulator